MHRIVATELSVGKTLVQSILKRKREIMDEYECNGNISARRPRKETSYSEVNSLTYQWFLDATAIIKVHLKFIRLYF